MARPTKSSDDYFEASRRPWVSLVFVLPLIGAYELGTLLFATDAATGTQTRIVAFIQIVKFFQLFGVTGRFIPSLTLIGVLLAVHLYRRDPWHIRGETLVGMAAESVGWALPLMAIAKLMSRFLLLQAGEEPAGIMAVVTSFGAGLYEELLFRVIFVGLLYRLLEHNMIDRRVNVAVTLLITSIAFSLYHYLGPEAFNVRTALFRTVAGVFFGAIYLWRGFGVTAGFHAAYDCLAHLL
jgi:membrane protease YdiL (CAAX protease family)